MSVMSTQEVKTSERISSDRNSNIEGASVDNRRRHENGRLRDQEVRNRIDLGPVFLSEEASILKRNKLH